MTIRTRAKAIHFIEGVVWNSSPPVGGGEKAEAETMLDSLAKRLILEGGWDDDDDEDDDEDPSSFALHSLWVHYNSSWKHSNAIFDIGDGGGSSEVREGDVKAESPPPNWRLLHGPPHVIETLDLSKSNVPQPNPVRLRFPPNVFRQANLDAFADVVVSIRNRISRYVSEDMERAEKEEDDDDDDGAFSKKPRCVELYGGVGTLGLNVSDLTEYLISSDENPNNADCFRESAEEMIRASVAGSDDAGSNANTKERTKYVPLNAADMVREERALEGEGAEVIIVDPPRRGLDDEVIDELVRSPGGGDGDDVVGRGRIGGGGRGGPRLLVYVSCGFRAFVRDCDKILAPGTGWKLDSAEGHVLFPGSDALETLAFFVRR